MNVSLRGDDPGTLSVTASIGMGAARALESIYNNAKRAALAVGKSEEEAKAAANAAVAAHKSAILTSANARIDAARAEGEQRRLLAIAQKQASELAELRAQKQTSNIEVMEPEPRASAVPLAIAASVIAYFAFKG